LCADAPLSDATPKSAGHRYESGAQGTLEHKDGKYGVTEITARPLITVKSEHDLAPAGDVVILYGDNNWFAVYDVWLFKPYGHKCAD
jgi:hypothetical protein